jgi:comEA protein
MKKGIITLWVVTFAVLFVLASIQPTLAGSDAGAKSKMTTEKAGQAMKDQKVNINTADAETLSSLEGVGPVLAGRIIDYRSKSGNFKTIADLKNVNGIGEKVFSAIAPMITVK